MAVTKYIESDVSVPSFTLYKAGGQQVLIDCNGNEMSMTDGTTTVDMKLSDLPSGATAKFQETCVAVITAGPDANGCYTVAPLHCWILRTDADGTCP